MNKKLSILIVFIVGVSFSACSTNTRIFYVDNIACSASRRDNGEWSYFTIELGTPNKPYNGKPALNINIPSVIEFGSDTVSIEEIKKIPNAKVLDITPVESTPFVGLWPQSAKEVDCGPFLSFVINNDKVLQIKITHAGKFRLIGAPQWYKLPCSEKDLIEIFGKPDKTYEWVRE